MNDEGLQRAVSDVSTEIHKFGEQFKDVMVKINEVEGAECECCGIVEDCTLDYIKQVKDSHCGKWVCGLCSEAVKERLKQAPKRVMEEAVSSHKEFCQKFNKTRINPKLSLAWAMRDIVKKSSQSRNSKNMSHSKMARSSSCDPRIDFQIE